MYYALAVVLVLIADQWLKYWVSLNIPLDVGEKALIPGVIKLVNIHNTGAAFGFLKGGDWRWVFVVIAVLFAAAVIYALKKDLIKGKLGRWAAVGVLAGAIGNCIDRVAYGYVVDMFKFEFLGSSRLNAIFNIADMFISCCGVLFCLYIIFGGEKDADAEGEDEERQPQQEKASAGKASAEARATARARAGAHAHPREGIYATARGSETCKACGAPADRPQEPICRVGGPAEEARSPGQTGSGQAGPDSGAAPATGAAPAPVQTCARAAAEEGRGGNGVLPGGHFGGVFG